MQENRNRRSEYTNMRNNSLNGSTVHRNRKRVVKMRLSDYIKRMGIVAGVSALIAVAGVNLAGEAIDKFSSKIELAKMASDFRVEAINPNTHRTDDNENYWYDYGNIANEIEDFDDNLGVGIYFCLRDLGEVQTERVMQYTEYETLDKYFETANYKDKDEFKDKIEQEILLSNELDEKQAELLRMQAEHRVITNEDIMVEGYGERR